LDGNFDELQWITDDWNRSGTFCGELMPLNTKGKKILASMYEQYGKDKGKQVFYASLNAGKIKGVEGKKKK
jgi:hypothetical protein